MAYQPKANSLPGKVLDFLRRNPEEVLTIDDIAAKFNAVRNNVHTLLAPAREADMLQRDRDELGEYIYRSGRHLGKLTSVASKVFITQAEVDALTVDTGVSMPLVSSNRGLSKWDTLLKKLTANGQSIQIPKDWHPGLSSHVSKVNPQQTGFKYVVRAVSDTHARIWRVAK